MKKRLLAWVLSFALALSLLPVGVLAAEPHPFQDCLLYTSRCV